MIMQRLYGLEWPMNPFPSPDGEEYGRACIEVAGVRAVDRTDAMLIFRSPEEADSALAGMAEEWRGNAERLELLAIPDSDALSPYDRFDDFAFRGMRGTAYVDARDVAVFRLHATEPEAEPAPALMQLEEHLIAAIAAEGTGSAADGGTWHVIERQLAELAERVARAYRCEVEWLDIARP